MNDNEISTKEEKEEEEFLLHQKINLNEKINMINFRKIQERNEFYEKISVLKRKIKESEDLLSFYKGETIQNLKYEELSNLEKRHIKLYEDVKRLITEKDLLTINSQNIIYTDICTLCKINKIDSVILPCSHLIYCNTCAINENYCMDCKKEILYVEKVFIINNS